MSNIKNVFNVQGEQVYVARGILQYLDENNFKRLLSQYEEAKKDGKKFYVGLYSNELINAVRGTDNMSGLVNDQDRINLVEAIDFVDGAFIIPSYKKEDIQKALELCVFRKNSQETEVKEPLPKYEIGYASGGFSNLHKGHIEHLKIMSEQCKTVIVAANSDELIQNYKHKKASVPDEVRRQILSHIRYVDMAIITNDYDKLKAVERVRELCGKSFNAIFVGSDWKGDPNWIEFEKKLSEMGIDVVFTDRPEKGISSTLIEKGKRNRNKKQVQNTEAEKGR